MTCRVPKDITRPTRACCLCASSNSQPPASRSGCSEKSTRMITTADHRKLPSKLERSWLPGLSQACSSFAVTVPWRSPCKSASGGSLSECTATLAFSDMTQSCDGKQWASNSHFMISSQGSCTSLKSQNRATVADQGFQCRSSAQFLTVAFLSIVLIDCICIDNS